MRIKLLFALFAIALLLSCVNTRIIRYETEDRPPKPDWYRIEIYDSENLTRPRKVIGIIRANAGKLHDPADTLEYIKAEARKMGGDALTDLTVEASAARAITQVGRMYVTGSVREIWTAKVIVWLEE